MRLGALAVHMLLNGYRCGPPGTQDRPTQGRGPCSWKAPGEGRPAMGPCGLCDGPCEAMPPWASPLLLSLLPPRSYFIPQLHTRMNVTPLAIHMTWVPLSK
jgi:hypothetical protein